MVGFGKLMHEHWEHKRKRSGGMSNPQIDAWYNLAMDNGAVGGKLIGAGGGGFLMFYAEDKVRLRHAMQWPDCRRCASISISKAPKLSFEAARLPFPVAILAGGLATRLRPVTLPIPKALVPVAGEPFISHQLRLLRREGV